MASYHKSNLGAFGRDLVVDLDGYTYTTPDEWLTIARLDGITESQLTGDYADEWADEQATAAVAELDAAELAVTEWQKS